jgi:NACHT conflict system protein
VRRALGRAIIDLLREHRDLFTGGPPDAEMAMLEAGLDISDEVLELDEALFKTPGELELLGRLKGPFARWLVSYGIVAAAQATAERLPAYFVLALHDEWGQRAGEYAVLSAVVKTPFTQAQDMERAWLRYEAHLWRQVNERCLPRRLG